MPIPTNGIELAVFAVNLVLTGMSAKDRYERLKNGIAANAEAEGRDITADEQALLDGLLELSKKARDGK